MTTIVLLTLSNIFMTFAWYGHLKYKSSPLWKAVLVSWLIASFEYCLQVPANRIGSSRFTTAGAHHFLKMMKTARTIRPKPTR